MTQEIDSVTVAGNTYSFEDSETGSAISIGVAYDFENESKMTPYIGGSYILSWFDDNDDDISDSYTLDLGMSWQTNDKSETFIEVTYHISPEETIDSVKVETAYEIGYFGGLRFRF